MAGTRGSCDFISTDIENAVARVNGLGCLGRFLGLRIEAAGAATDLGRHRRFGK